MAEQWGASDDEDEWEDGFVQDEEVFEDEEEDEPMDVVGPIADIELDLAGATCDGAAEESHEAGSSSAVQGNSQSQKSKKRRYASGAVSEADREEALTWHRVHLLCLVARAQLVHRWITGTPAIDYMSTLVVSNNDIQDDADDAGAAAEVRAFALSGMPPKLMAEVNTALELATQSSTPGALPRPTLAAVSSWFASTFHLHNNSQRTSSSGGSISYAAGVDSAQSKMGSLSSTKENLPPAAFACLSCASCGVSRREALTNLGACKTCRRAFYCSKACQVAHWRTGGHRNLCRRPGSKRISTRPSSSTSLQSNQEPVSSSSLRHRPIVDDGGAAGSHPSVLLNRLKGRMAAAGSTTNASSAEACTRHEVAQVHNMTSIPNVTECLPYTLRFLFYTFYLRVIWQLLCSILLALGVRAR